MKLRGFEHVKIAPSSSNGKHSAPVCFKPPAEKRKLHFLDRTDPNFRQDLATSDKHVAHVVAELQTSIDASTYLNNLITDIQLTQLPTICRENVTRRKAFSDKGDVELTWTYKTIPFRAILEVKQRKSPKFTSLADFPYDTVLTDEKRLFDKIRKRGDTIGYLVTNHDKSTFLFVSHDRVEATFTTHTAPDRWKGGRVRTYLDVPVAEFVEGTQLCTRAIVDALVAFSTQTDADIHARQVRMCREELDDLRAQLAKSHKLSEKLRRQIDKQESALHELENNT